MSMFENDQYRWRETYFILFDAQRRPTLKQVQKTLSGLNCRLTLTNLRTDEEGHFESLTVLSPDDFAALDVCYLAGDEVTEQAGTLFQELKTPACTKGERARLERLRHCNARFDVLHFEQVTDLDDEPEEMLDPSTLLIVMEALVGLADGIAIDPQSGTLM
jgi:hypothetical protein